MGLPSRIDRKDRRGKKRNEVKVIVISCPDCLLKLIARLTVPFVSASQICTKCGNIAAVKIREMTEDDIEVIVSQKQVQEKEKTAFSQNEKDKCQDDSKQEL